VALHLSYTVVSTGRLPNSYLPTQPSGMGTSYFCLNCCGVTRERGSMKFVTVDSLF